MNKVLRHALTGSAIATGMMIAASPAQADSVCVFGTATLPSPSIAVDCTDPNGNGHTEVGGTTFASGSTGSPTAVVALAGGGATTSFTTGYIESTTAGRGVLSVTSDSTLLYTGTGSTLVGQAGATAATTLSLTGTSVTFFSGTLSALGAGSTALAVTANGGAGLGAITGTINGPITSAGTGVVLNSTNAAGTGNISLTTLAGSNVTAGAGDAISVTNAGTGTVTVTAGSAITATGGDAIEVDSNNAAAGAITVTTTAGQPIRSSGGDGINVSTLGTGLVTVNNAAAIGSTVAAPNTLQDGIEVESNIGSLSVINSGAIGSATDRAQDDGIDAQIFNAASTGNISVTGSGAIFAADEGILAETFGTGTVTVNYTGAINSTGGSGIEATTTTGALSVTAGAITTTGGNAITTSSTTGNQTITANGVISANAGGIAATATTGTITANVNAALTAGANGVTLTSGGAKTVNVGTAGNINSTGGNDITFNGAGTGTVNNLGTIGGDTLGVAVAGPGSGAITVNNGSTSNSTAVLNGRLTLSANADTVNNRAVFNTQGISDFGAGTDTFNNFTGGVLNLVGNTTFANLEAFNNTGRINFSSGVVFTGPAIAFVNGPGSFIDTAGNATVAGFTSMSNAGTIDLAAGTFTVPVGTFTNTATGVVIADEGATTITGQTTFVNNGIIDLQDGAANDTLTINSSYSGVGRLQVDVSGTVSDLLVINGTTAGATSIDVNVIGLGVFVPAGILVVDATGASLNPNTFVMGEESGNPLINFDVEQRGNDYFLVTLLDPETAFVPLAATGLIREMWYQSADEVFAHTLAPTAKLGFTAFGTVYGSQRRTGGTNSQTVNGVQYDADNNIEIDRYGIQGGVGYGFGMAEVGLTAGYANAQANGDGEFDADGYNIGIYGRYGGLTGFHAEALFKHDSYDVEFDGLFDGNDVDASSTGVDGSIGYRMAIGVVPSLDIHAGLSHVWSDMDGVSAFGFGYDFDDMTSTRGRLGVRGNFGGLYNPYLAGTAYHEFSGDGDVTITNGGFSSGLSSTGKGTWVRLEGGLAGGQGTYGLNVAGWVDFGDTRGAGIRAGFRF